MPIDEAAQKTRTELMLQLQISNTAFTQMVEIGVFIKDDGRIYLSPWGEERMFKLRDVAGFLSRETGNLWTIQHLTYNYSDLIVDLHQGKAIRALNRITLHDFRSLVMSIDKETRYDRPALLPRFDRRFSASGESCTA